jgi:lipopolysaccharide/colanic/teichoic acid biosynthesis glycosyltransferase
MPLKTVNEKIAVSSPSVTFYEIGKRGLDILGGLVGIILFAPVMIATALYIKITSPGGPVLADIPLRVGKGGKLFRMYKFRSMFPNAHQYLLDHPELHKKYLANNYKLEAKEDPRLIKGAVFMRKTSIDELPQFFNVLFGQMSLVGPRAYYQFEVDEQRERYPESSGYLDKALTVKPGITGPWQVGGRSLINFTDRVKLDADYTDNKSLLYDVLIILKTPYVVLTGKGAL